MRLLEKLLLGAAAAAWVASGRAQEPEFQLRVDVPLVSVDVRVINSRGEPMTSLTGKDFVVLEDAEEQQIQVFSSVDTPYNILLLFDRSGSTENQWTFMQRAAARFLRNLRSQDSLAIGAFDDGLTMLSSWSDTRKEVETSIEQLTKRGPGGGTNLYQTLERAAQREFRNTTGRRAIVVLTDGRDAGLGTQRPGAADPAFVRTQSIVQNARVPLYFVALNTDRNPGTGYSSASVVGQARSRMELLANATGGAIFFPKNIGDIVDVYDQVSKDLSSSYSLAYTSKRPSASGQTRKIEVRVHGANVKQSRETYITP
jgi:VWFA-related protein